MKILLIDNYDSFTYNLYHYLSALKCTVEVHRNDKIKINEIKKSKYQKIVIFVMEIESHMSLKNFYICGKVETTLN